MSISVVKYSEGHSLIWDEFCEISLNATFLHTRRFLAYHGDRFADESVLIYNDSELVGVLPLARSPGDHSIVVSHPGATFGGLVVKNWLIGERQLTAFYEIFKHLSDRGIHGLSYRPVPHIYQKIPRQDDLYILFRLEALRERVNLSSAVDLTKPRSASKRRQRSLKKAARNVCLKTGVENLAAFWRVLEKALKDRHAAAPVHTLEEITLLTCLFPDLIDVYVAELNSSVVAGVIIFKSSSVWRAQYIASSGVGNTVSGLDAVFDQVMSDAYNDGASFFDFGTSNEDSGRILNEGLYRYKSEYGGGGVIYESYFLTW